MSFKLFLFTLFLPSFAFAQTEYPLFETTGSPFVHPATHFKLPYRVMFPQGYDRNDKTKKYPLILFLHGAGERGSDNESQLKNGGKFFETNRENFPAIVLIPQCPQKPAVDGGSDTIHFWANVKTNEGFNQWNFHYQPTLTPQLQAAIALVKKFKATEAVDSDRVYIMGLSMGAMGTYEALTYDHDLFAAAIPIAGTGDPKQFHPDSRVPFWIFHGDQDEYVSYASDVAMKNKLKALRKTQGSTAEVKFSTLPGVHHGESFDKASASEGFLEWLFAQHLNSKLEDIK